MPTQRWVRIISMCSARTWQVPESPSSFFLVTLSHVTTHLQVLLLNHDIDVIL